MPLLIYSLFDSSSHAFTSFPIAANFSSDSIRIPVGNYSDLPTVEFGTSMVILLLFFFLSDALRTTAGRLASNQLHSKAE
jgi:hypothetical protein